MGAAWRAVVLPGLHEGGREGGARVAGLLQIAQGRIVQGGGSAVLQVVGHDGMVQGCGPAGLGSALRGHAFEPGDLGFQSGAAGPSIAVGGADVGQADAGRGADAALCGRHAHDAAAAGADADGTDALLVNIWQNDRIIHGGVDVLHSGEGVFSVSGFAAALARAHGVKDQGHEAAPGQTAGVTAGSLLLDAAGGRYADDGWSALFAVISWLKTEDSARVAPLAAKLTASDVAPDVLSAAEVAAGAVARSRTRTRAVSGERMGPPYACARAAELRLCLSAP